MAIQANLGQDETRQDIEIQYKIIQDNIRLYETRQGKQDNTRQGKTRQDKKRQCKT